MIAHIKREHLFPDGRPRRRHFVEAMFRRDDVLRPERYFTSPRSVPVAEADVVEPLTCIAMRQVRQGSDAVNSIWEGGVNREFVDKIQPTSIQPHKHRAKFWSERFDYRRSRKNSLPIPDTETTDTQIPFGRGV